MGDFRRNEYERRRAVVNSAPAEYPLESHNGLLPPRHDSPLRVPDLLLAEGCARVRTAGGRHGLLSTLSTCVGSRSAGGAGTCGTPYDDSAPTRPHQRETESPIGWSISLPIGPF